MKYLTRDAAFVAKLAISPLLIALGALIFNDRLMTGSQSSIELVALVMFFMVGGFAIGQYTIESRQGLSRGSRLRLTLIFYAGAFVVAQVPLILIEYLHHYGGNDPQLIFVSLYSITVFSVSMVVVAIVSEHETVDLGSPLGGLIWDDEESTSPPDAEDD